MRMVVLAETGTRGLLGAVIGGKGERSEVPLARRLVPLLREGMLLLADRAYDAAELLKEAAATGRTSWSAAAPPASPGPVRSCPTVLPVPDRRPRGADHRGGPGRARRRRHPARGRLPADHHLAGLAPLPGRELIRLYRERWEIEVAYLALRHTLLAVRAPLPRPAGAEQELWRC